MATPSGTIGLSDVNAELGLSPTALISMNDAAVRTLAGVPSGTISMQNLQNKSNRVSIPLTISSPTYNYDVYNNRGPTYNPGTSDITVTINPGVVVGSTSTGSFAFLVPSSFSPGDTVTVVNQGVIQGRGGNGGLGGRSPGTNTVGAGSAGGAAVSVSRPTTITNNGTLAGGGGGGGGGGTGQDGGGFQAPGGGGGGGGAGFDGGTGAQGGLSAGGSEPQRGNPGSPGTSPAGGAGGAGKPSDNVPSGAGGAGGGRGASGSSGQPTGGGTFNGGGGGGAGAYISGQPFVTYPVTGTRQGPSS
jgi:hypothetical protein